MSDLPDGDSRDSAAAGEAGGAAPLEGYRPARTGGLKRRVAPLVLAGTLLIGAIGGGAAGSAATLYLVSHGAPSLAPPALAAPLRPSADGDVMATSGPANPGATEGVAAIYRQVSPSVVTVVVSKSASAGGSPVLPRGHPAIPPQLEGEGTGIVIDAQGHILTNNHVVDGATELSVRLVDGTTLGAKVVGTDPGSDLAVIQASIPADKLAVATLGDSDQVQPGDPAIAIGSPFGLDHTVTAGIISGLKREFGTAGGRPMRGLIQTDTPINPGNSGGPLLNSRGEVVGITTSIESPVRGSIGVGFAIPINSARQLLPKLVAGQEIQHPWLGISGVAVDPALAQSLGLTVQSGVLVVEVAPNSPAASAGLRGASAGAANSAAAGEVPKGGDVIVAVDKTPVKSSLDIGGYVDGKSVGSTVTLSVLRDGKPLDLTATLGAWPIQPDQAG